jgi:hypothetical protein
MEPEGLLPRTQEPPTCPYPEHYCLPMKNKSALMINQIILSRRLTCPSLHE